MKNIILLISLILILFSSCASNDSELEKMIPENASGVVCINANNIFQQGGLLNEDGNLFLPEDLKSIIDKNTSSKVGKMITTVTEAGVDLDSKIFIFFTPDFFKSGMLMNISNIDEAKSWIEKKEGTEFKSKDGIDYITSGPTLYALNGNVFFIGSSLGAQDDIKSIKEVSKILNNSGKSIIDNAKIKELIESKHDLIAYFAPTELNRLINSNSELKSISSKLPIMRFMTEADVEAIVAKVQFEKKKIKIETEAISNGNNEFAQLINSIESKPSSEFLQIMPASMDNVISLSLNGNNILKLPEMNTLLGALSQIPLVKYIDVKSIIATINGPLAIGISKDPTFVDEYNYVVALNSTNPELILNQIKHLGKMAGQDPEKNGNEYVYEYLNKRITIGQVGQVIYMKMLDYEQPEQNLYSQKMIKELFSNSKIGIYIHCKDLSGEYSGRFLMGAKSATQCNGQFVTEDNGENAVLDLLRTLCSIKTDYNFDDSDSSLIPIDSLSEYK